MAQNRAHGKPSTNPIINNGLAAELAVTTGVDLVIVAAPKVYRAAINYWDNRKRTTSSLK